MSERVSFDKSQESDSGEEEEVEYDGQDGAEDEGTRYNMDRGYEEGSYHDQSSVQSTPRYRSSSARPARKPRPRTAMGVTIGEPLTVLAEATPGPQYDINQAFAHTRPKSAAYSIKAPHKFRANTHPAPNKYDTSGDMAFKTRAERPKSVAFKAKGYTAPYHARHDYHVRYGPGAGHYRPRQTDTGREARKFSFGIRHKDGLHAGWGNRTIPPTDTHGFETPGPDYWPADEVGEEHTFGLAKIYNYETCGPGPLREDVGTGIKHPVGVTHILAGKLEKSLDLVSTPGPAEYDIPSDMGQAIAMSLSGRHSRLPRFVGPSPSDYDPQRLQYPPSRSLARREFDRTLVPTPAPCDYDKANGDDGKPVGPKHVIAEYCQPVFPDILQYRERTRMMGTPSPNDHGAIRDFSYNHAPSYSLRRKFSPRPNSYPAPNEYPYEYNTPAAPHSARAPEYSMGKTLQSPCNRRGFNSRGTNEDGPGPDEYLPDRAPCEPRAPSHSFGSKHKHQNRNDSMSPGPKYSLEIGTTRKGSNSGRQASFKGRQSNYMFQGRPLRPVSALA